MDSTQDISVFDPLVATPDDPELVRMRTEETVSQNAKGVWFLSRFDDVLAATKNIDTFNASFREPGVVEPDEEQNINEIPEPRHAQNVVPRSRAQRSRPGRRRSGQRRTVTRGG